MVWSFSERAVRLVYRESTWYLIGEGIAWFSTDAVVIGLSEPNKYVHAVVI